MTPREQEVLNHFLETGKTFKIPDLRIDDARELHPGIEAVWLWSDQNGADDGWIPTKELLREEMLRLRVERDSLRKTITTFLHV